MWKIQKSAKTATERSIVEMVTIWIECLTKQNHLKSSVSGCHSNTNTNIHIYIHKKIKYSSILHSSTIRNNRCSTVSCFMSLYNACNLTRMAPFLRIFNHTSIPEILVNVNRVQIKIPAQEKYIFS